MAERWEIVIDFALYEGKRLVDEAINPKDCQLLTMPKSSSDERA